MAATGQGRLAQLPSSPLLLHAVAPSPAFLYSPCIGHLCCLLPLHVRAPDAFFTAAVARPPLLTFASSSPCTSLGPCCTAPTTSCCYPLQPRSHGLPAATVASCCRCLLLLSPMLRAAAIADHYLGSLLPSDAASLVWLFGSRKC
ncbi:hypothetical protein D1007_44545 [Hordeum vulgare]|nr:hypothetical protein D1007_44545 [Hordeum vulgare]